MVNVYSQVPQFLLQLLTLIFTWPCVLAGGRAVPHGFANYCCDWDLVAEEPQQRPSFSAPSAQPCGGAEA